MFVFKVRCIQFLIAPFAFTLFPRNVFVSSILNFEIVRAYPKTCCTVARFGIFTKKRKYQYKFIIFCSRNAALTIYAVFILSMRW